MSEEEPWTAPKVAALMSGVLPALQLPARGLAESRRIFSTTKMCRQKHAQVLVMNNDFDVFGFETRAFAKQKGLACAHIARKALVIL